MAEPQVAQKSLPPLEVEPAPSMAGVHDGGASARGQAAELLAAEAAPAQAPAAGDAGPMPVTEDQLNTIANLYGMIVNQQVNAIKNVQASVKEQDPPSLAEAIITSLGATALGGAIGFVGGLVASAGATLARSRQLTTATIQGVSDAMSDAAKVGLDTALKQGFEWAAAESQDPVERFFRTQVNALLETSDLQRIAFDQTQRAALRRAAQPHQEAQALIESLMQARTSAYVDQRNRTLDAWVAAQARNEVGLSADVPALALGQEGNHVGAFLGDAAANPGSDFVLTIQAQLNEPGGEVAVESASMPGANQNIRNLVSNRKLSELDVPIVVHANVPGGTVKVARNEANAVWNRSEGAGNPWLGRRSKIEEGKAPKPHEGHGCDHVPPTMQTFFGTTVVLQPMYAKDFDNGARVLIEKDMKHLAVSPDRMES